MRGSRYAARLLAAVLPAVLLTTLTAGSAFGVYPSEPAPQEWVADAPVHALLTSGNVVFVGTAAGIRAVTGTTGALLWSVPTDGDVRALALSDDGTQLFAGGGFKNVAGAAHAHLVALSPSDGSVISSWRSRTDGMVRDLLVDGNRLYVAGTFASIGGAQEMGLGALDTTTGQRLAAFTAYTDNNVYGLAKSGPNLIVSGRFTAVNGTPRAALAAVSLDDGTLTGWNPALVCSSCYTYWDVVVDGTNAYIASSGPGGRLAAFNLDTGVQPWHFIRADGDVQVLTLADGLVYAGGHFGQVFGPAARHVLAAVDTSTGEVEGTFAPWPYLSYPGAWALATNSNTLYAGGNFTGVRSGGVNNHVPYFAAFRDPNLPPPVTPPPPPPPPPANRGTWAFDEKSGTVAHDSSTYGNDGSIHGAVLGRPGRYGTSFRFDDNAYVSVPSRQSLNPKTQDFSYSAYVDLTRRPATGKVYVIMRKGVSSSTGGEFRLELTSAGRARCVARGATGVTGQVTGPKTSLADGRWHKIECRRTGTRLSVVVGGVTTSRTVDIGSISNNRTLVIGSSYGKSSGLHGRVDQVRMRIG